MKTTVKRIRTVLGVMLGLAFTTMANSAIAQEVGLEHPIQVVVARDGFNSLQESLIRLIRSANILQLGGYNYYGSSCLLGYLMDSGTTQGYSQSYQAGVKYIILGAGDNDVEDLDLWITPEQDTNVVLEHDLLDDASPVITFTPKVDGRYTIFTRNNKSDGPSFCSVVIMIEDENARFSLRPLCEALDHAISLARVRSLFAKEFPQNNLVMFGGTVPGGSSSNTYNLKYSTGPYVAVASGDNTVESIALTIDKQYRPNNQAGTRLGSDNDRTPVVGFNTRSGDFTFMNMKNSGNNTAFIFGFVLHD